MNLVLFSNNRVATLHVAPSPGCHKGKQGYIVPSITNVPILFLFLQIGTMTVCIHPCRVFRCIKHTFNRLLRWLHTLESA